MSQRNIMQTAIVSKCSSGSVSLELAGTFKPSLIVVNACNNQNVSGIDEFGVYGITAQGDTVTFGKASLTFNKSSNSGGGLNSFILDGATIFTKIYCTSPYHSAISYIALAVYEFK